MAKSSRFPLLFDGTVDRLNINDVAEQIDEGCEAVEVWHFKDGKLENIAYEVTSVPKPFGGRQWYLVCPITQRRARILYKFNNDHRGLFAHRSAFPKACYTIQTQSKVDRVFTSMRKAEAKLQNATIRRHAKLVYRGEPIKRLASAKRRYEITSEIVNANTIRMLDRSARDLDRMIVSLVSIGDSRSTSF